MEQPVCYRAETGRVVDIRAAAMFLLLGQITGAAGERYAHSPSVGSFMFVLRPSASISSFRHR